MRKYLAFAIFTLAFAGIYLRAEAATFYISKPEGSLNVGNIFSVSFYLNTEGESINAIEANLTFPADKLQLVSPTSGQSVISFWTKQPEYDNHYGKISFEGGIPSGIESKSALISVLTFRVRSVGTASIGFGEGNKALRADGTGANALTKTLSTDFNLNLPPPAGPRVTSPTHPDQVKWYESDRAIFEWEKSGDDAFSYSLTDKPTDIPDDSPENSSGNAVYENLPSGTHYFHIRARKNGNWGGTTHFAINIDKEIPAEFKIKILPAEVTISKNPVIIFGTTARFSGVDHYEYRVIDLREESLKEAATSEAQLFAEAQSPQILTLAPGDYDVIVRAYGKNGNFREETARIRVASSLLQFITENGLELTGVNISWVNVSVGISILLLLLYILLKLIMRQRDRLDSGNSRGEREIKKKLKELEILKKKYGIAILLLVSLFGVGKIETVKAGGAPPIPSISIYHEDPSNMDVFYAVGKAEPGSRLVAFLKDTERQETTSEAIFADQNGDWTYRSPDALRANSYEFWVRTYEDGKLSPSSPVIKFTVSAEALEFGSGRLSFQTLYIILASLLSLALIIILIRVIIHGYRLRLRHRDFRAELKKTEKRLEFAFAMLQGDIEKELNGLRKKHPADDRYLEKREEEITNDLLRIREHIGQELYNIIKETEELNQNEK